MARIKDFGIQQTLLGEADALLIEYEKLKRDMREIKKQAMNLYVEIEYDQGKMHVAQALEKILKIPE